MILRLNGKADKFMFEHIRLNVRNAWIEEIWCDSYARIISASEMAERAKIIKDLATQYPGVGQATIDETIMIIEAELAGILT